MVTNTFLYTNNKAPVDPDNVPSEDTDGMVIEQVTPAKDTFEKEFDKVQENTLV